MDVDLEATEERPPWTLAGMPLATVILVVIALEIAIAVGVFAGLILFARFGPTP